MVQHDYGPWGSLVVLAGKANFIWMLCVSYRGVNRITRLFKFLFWRCNDVAIYIKRAKFCISINLDSGYWQVPIEAKSRCKMAFFGVQEKLTWTTMPMGALNAAPVFTCMMHILQDMWQKRAEQQRLEGTSLEVIMDDILFAVLVLEVMFAYFEILLEVLQHHCCMLKLKKCRFLAYSQEFVGIDVTDDGNFPAESKASAFQAVGRPANFTDLRMLIGMFGFYALWIPFFEWEVKPWRLLLCGAPMPGKRGSTNAPDMRIGQCWEAKHHRILEDLKEEVLAKPILMRPDFKQRFYLKTDWLATAMGAVLLQADDNPEAMEAERIKEQGGPCTFDLTVTGRNLRLQPVAFLPRLCLLRESRYHSYCGKAAGVWAIKKLWLYLYGREFTWITDFSGLQQFFKGDDLPSHVVQRWRVKLLWYNFTIVQRPSRMMAEVDLLSRYNHIAKTLRKKDEEQ